MVNHERILSAVYATLADIPDPELPCSIVDLGLVDLDPVADAELLADLVEKLVGMPVVRQFPYSV